VYEAHVCQPQRHIIRAVQSDLHEQADKKEAEGIGQRQKGRDPQRRLVVRIGVFREAGAAC